MQADSRSGDRMEGSGPVGADAAVYSAGRGGGKRAVPALCPIAAATLLAGLLSGCAMQLGPVFGDGDTTGSITPRDGRFSVNMTDEDWRRAQASVDQALDPAPTPVAGGKGAPGGASWSNPASGLRGTTTPVAGRFAEGAQVCQVFLATLVEGVDTNWYQGKACQAGGKAWTIVSAGPWRPPGHEGPRPSAAQPPPGLAGTPATAPALPSPAL